MKIQSLNRLSNPRAAKLFRASFIYLVLFAIGITVYVSEVRDAGGQSFLDKILGTYTSNVKEERKGQLTKVKETLDDYATLKTEDDANLASCDTKVLSVKYNNANNCSSAACKDNAEDAELYGWMSLYKCQDRPNKNIGCKDDYYVGGTVDAIKVNGIPLLDFLASIDPIDQSDEIDEDDPFSYTQPYCFYNMFRNFESTTRENPLSFGTNIEGPLYINTSSKLAVIRYDKLGTGAQCWGINWDDYTNIANFDVKAFLKQYWVNQNSDYNQAEQPDTWWSFILNFFKKKYNASMASLFNGNDIKSVSSVYNDGTQSLCKDIPGGAVTNLFETKKNDSGSNKEYELTRQVKEFSKPEICDMYLSGDSNLRGVSGCVIGTGSNSFTITTGNRGTEFNRLKYKTEIILGKKVVTSYCDAKPLCGFDWQCKEETYEDVYNYCKQNHSNIPIIKGTNIRYKTETEPISYINFPNGLTLLKHVYNLEQQLASPYIINYGQNNGIRINVTRTLYDINNCGGNCSYGSSLDYRAKPLADDYVENLVDSLDSGLTEYINVEQNNPYSADLKNKGGMQPIVSRGNDLALTEVNLDYIFPHLGDVPRILERISVYFSNQANEDTASTLVEWLFNRLPLPSLRNNNLGEVVLKLCKQETNDNEDCFDNEAVYSQIQEDKTDYNVISKDTCTNNLKNMLDYIEGKGVTPMIYTSDYQWRSLTNLPEWANDHYPLWLARWSSIQPTAEILPGNWSTWKIWQYTDSNYINGKKFDRNKANTNTGIVGEGLDVSHWNGTVDWLAAYNDGIRFAIIKASDGQSFVDDKFIINWNAAKALGIKVSAYHFFRCDVDGVTQGELFWNTYKTAGSNADFELAIDVEIPEDEPNNVYVDSASENNFQNIVNKFGKVDSLGTYIRAKVYLPNKSDLLEFQIEPNVDDNLGIDYFLPDSSNNDYTCISTNPAPTSSDGTCFMDNVLGSVALPIDGAYPSWSLANQSSAGHVGVDLGPGNAPVYSVASGKVLFVRNVEINDSIYKGCADSGCQTNQCYFNANNCTCDWCNYPDIVKDGYVGYNDYANVVAIQYNDGIAIYAHLKTGSIKVVEGQCVSRNTEIATVGNTGHSTGYHLHFEIRPNGRTAYNCTDVVNCVTTGNFSESLSSPRIPTDNPIPPQVCEDAAASDAQEYSNEEVKIDISQTVCPFKVSSELICRQGPYGQYTHGCSSSTNKDNNSYGVDIDGDVETIAPENGYVTEAYDANDIYFGGNCPGTQWRIYFKGDSGITYAFGHQDIYQSTFEAKNNNTYITKGTPLGRATTVLSSCSHYQHNHAWIIGRKDADVIFGKLCGGENLSCLYNCNSTCTVCN